MEAWGIVPISDFASRIPARNMIDLEIQALALTREGLLLETGRLAASEGFVLVRQQLVDDPHGTLLAMVVRGSRFKKWALESALARCGRFVGFESLPAGVEFQPHFATTLLPEPPHE